MFDLFGGKTKFFAAGLGILGVLEASGVIPAGGVEALVKAVEAIFGAGMVFGFRDAITKLKS